jgi:multidrug resistance protein, MATE family
MLRPGRAGRPSVVYVPRPVAPRDSIRAELRPLLRLAAPLALAQAGQALMGAVDVAVLGRARPELLAGAGLGNALFFGFAVFGMGVMQGLDPLVAQALGAGDAGRARRLVWQGVWLALGLALALAVPIVLAPGLLVPAGIAPEVAVEAVRFLSWRLVGLPFALLFFAPRAYLLAHGRTRPMVVAVVLANVLNLALDLLLVFGGAAWPEWTGPLHALPALGVAGAANASNAASLVQLLVLALALRASPHPAGERARARPDPRELALALRVGLPTGLHVFAEVAFFSLASILAGRLGAVPLSAHQVALQLASVTFTVALGLGNGGSMRVGLAVGAGDRRAARRAGLAAFAGAASFMACTALVFLLFPGAVARLMTDEPAVIAAAIPLLRVAALFQLSDGLQAVGAGVLRGAGVTRFTFAVNMVAYWVVGLPLALLLAFGLGWGVVGLWAAFVVCLALVAASLVVRFLRVSSREIVPLGGREAA